jgi:prophage regulatory protein
VTAPARFLRLPAVLERTGLTKATLYRRIAAGSFPPSIKIGPAMAAWREADIDGWMENPLGWSAAA